MHRDELAAWLRLTLTPGIGSDRARRLLAAFGLPEAIFDQPLSALRELLGPATAAALRQPPEGFDAQLQATWDWLQADAPNDGQRRVLTLADADYPTALLAIEDPPPLLYLLGPAVSEAGSNVGLDQAQTPSTAIYLIANLGSGLAMVGSRNPTPQGLLTARQFARALSASGLTVVSGLALGIDAAAHEGALEGCPEGSLQLATVAVIGTGIDRVYPRQNRDLAHRIARRGLIVSEYPIGTPPLAANFPRRNRLISAFAQGTLVVEAALQSGSLITARLAGEQGKEVFAIPGSIHGTQSRGCHQLIRQGAKLVESAQDILEELRLPPQAGGAAPAAAADVSTHSAAVPGSDTDPLLTAIGADPVSLDALQARCGLPTPELQARLLELELEGRLARLPGGLFQRLGLA